jgi:LysM repeat protein
VNGRSAARRRAAFFIVILILLQLLLMVQVSYAAPPAPVWHYVRWGENLTSIAWRYGTTIWAIASLNGIHNVNLIYAGQWLQIPTSGWYPSPPGPTYYVVQAGDTLSAIAWRYGTTVWAIANANGIWNINLIYVGQTLMIP